MHTDHLANRLVQQLRDVRETNEESLETSARTGKGRGMGSGPALNTDSSFTIPANRRLRMATAADNAEILSQIRELVRRELSNLTLGSEFDIKKANILHKLAQTYAILDCHVDKEHRKYDLTGKTDAELAAMEEAARLRLEK